LADSVATPHTASEEFAKRRLSTAQQIQGYIHGHPWVSPLVALALSVIVFAILAPTFRTPHNLSLVLQQASVLAAVSAGQALVVLSGGVDLSVGVVMVLSTLVIGKLVVDAHAPGLLALLVGLMIGGVAGCVNGYFVAYLKMNPFIVTLATLSIFGAMVVLVSGGASIDAESFGAFLNWTATASRIGAFTVTAGMIVVVAIYLTLGYALDQTAWGVHLYAVGNDAEAASLIGIRVARVKFSAYVVAGVIGALAGWVLIGRIGGADPQSGATVNLDSITAVVIGGISPAGGRGSIFGAVFGAVIVTVLRNGLFLVGVDALYQDLAVGVLIVVAVGLDQWIKLVRA
jgi:fructose transport system permease protein